MAGRVLPILTAGFPPALINAIAAWPPSGALSSTRSRPVGSRSPARPGSSCAQPLEIAIRGRLTPAQRHAVRVLAQHDTGILVAPPEAGKTVMGARLVATRARYVLGLTATPRRRDGHHPITRFQLGPVRHTIDPKSLGGVPRFTHLLVVWETGFQLPPGDEELGIQEIYGRLAGDHARNELILDDVIAAVDEGRSPVLLTERREHLELLARRLGDSCGIWWC